MKLKILSSFLLVLGIALSSCSPGATATASLEPPTVQDEPSLLKVLQSAGVTVETGDSITQEFFTPEGHTVKVNDADLQVFQYASADAMEKETGVESSMLDDNEARRYLDLVIMETRGKKG